MWQVISDCVFVFLSFQTTGKDPYCFVEFHTNSDAAKALYQMDRRFIMGKVRI